jgi:excisionase family DNA binding protein
MERLVSIGEASNALGVSITTLRRWEAAGRLRSEHTVGGHRRYDLAKLRPEMFRAEVDTKRRTVAYARVSSHEQKEDLAKDVLEIITVFSARLYGSRSRKNQKLLDGV